VQLSLTARASASYGLWKWLASSSSRLWKWSCNHVLQLVRVRLTVYGNGWQAILPVYGNGFRSGTSKNQRLHKKLGNSEIGLHTDLGNSELKKLHLNKNWWNCDRNLRQSAPIGRKLRWNSRPLKQNPAPTARLFKKLTLRLATILSPLRAREKIKNWPGQLESYFTNFGKLRQKNFTLMT